MDCRLAAFRTSVGVLEFHAEAFALHLVVIVFIEAVLYRDARCGAFGPFDSNVKYA